MLPGPFHERWSLAFVQPLGSQPGAPQRAFYLNFSILVSRNGFRRLGEATTIFFQKTHGGFRLGEIEFTHTSARGQIQSKGQTISWDLAMAPRQDATVELIPARFKKLGLVQSSIDAPGADLAVTGKIIVNGETIEWDKALGSSSHQTGQSHGHSWTLARSNSFFNEQGVPVPFVFEGVSVRGHILGGIPGPRLSSLYFLYQGQAFQFDSIRDALRLKSRNTVNQWHFQAERGEMQFRGFASAEHKDFAGLSFEDTSGSMMYVSTSEFADVEIHIFKNGKLETALRSNQSASFEIISRNQNPYVPVLV
jgi:hypothetical protein